MPGRDNDEICQRYAIPKLEQVSIMYKALRSKYGTLQGWSKISISHQPTVWIWFGLTDEVFIVKKNNNNNVIKSEGRKKTEKPQDNSDLTYTLRFKGSLKEFEIEFSGMNIHCTINHKGQKTLHETAGGKKRKNRSMSGGFQKHFKCRILSIHPSSAYGADGFHMHCIIRLWMASSVSILCDLDLFQLKPPSLTLAVMGPGHRAQGPIDTEVGV